MSDPFDTTLFAVDPRRRGQVTLRTPPSWSSVQFTWGEAVITFHADGSLHLQGCPTMDAAAIAFWQAVARWAPAGITVTLPEGYGEETPP